MRILITGASQGIGEAICKRLIQDKKLGKWKEPLHIFACGYSHNDELSKFASEVSSTDATCTPLLGDLNDPSVPQGLISQATKSFGELDAIVANAGISRTGSLLSTSLDDWDNLFSINLRSMWLLCRAAHNTLSRTRGTIITLGSMSGVQPQPGLGAYSVSKTAVIMLTRLMAQEWAEDGIRVNCVSPGMIITPMTEDNYRDGEFRKERESLIPAGRIGIPSSDIAGIISFLLGPDANYISGQNILADGGICDSMLRILPARRT